MTIAIVRREVPATARTLETSGLSPVLARVYAARGIGSAAELDHSLAALPPFQTLLNIDAAARRLALAIAQQEQIVIVADYDADGATACAVGVRGLRALGALVDFTVPNRFEYGYGLTPEIVTLAAQKQPRLIVTVDNGIASVDGVAAARALGIDVLITDHHLPGAELPTPAIIVNPNQVGCTFPSKHIAGVGVMFYVLIATRARMREDGQLAAAGGPNLSQLLDLVALGTVADVVRLDQTNRILVEQGLARLRDGRAQPGVAALFAIAGRDARRAAAFDFGFVAGPRLNAAGRLADMSLGIRCLLTDEPGEATALATQLDALNRARRDVEATMQDEALNDLDTIAAGTTADRYTVCLYRPEWHQGVVGIVASRLKDAMHRPTIVFGRGANGELKGSGRSIAGFHLRDALDLVSKRAPGVINKFGGHAFAAGLSLAETALPAFVEAFEIVARAQLTSEQLARVCETDGALPAKDMTLAVAEALRGQVWGQGMPAPRFDDRFNVVASRIVGGKHTRLTLELAPDGAQEIGEHPVDTGGHRPGAGNRGRFDAILFRYAQALPPKIRAAYRLDINEWQGTRALELIIEHWEPV